MFEALLFAADEPLDEVTVATAATGIEEAEVSALAERLEQAYFERGHAITVQRVGGGWRLATRSQYAEVIKRHLRHKIRTRLSRASLEAISIIAYRQPVSRPEIESLRGVDSSQVLRHLLERDLIRITGRAEAPGRPLLYATTNSFLTYFGLEDLNSLPKPKELLGEPDEADGVEVPRDEEREARELTLLAIPDDGESQVENIGESEAEPKADPLPDGRSREAE